MSKLWDDLKDNMKEWSSSAVEKAEEMSRVALSKTEAWQDAICPVQRPKLIMGEYHLNEYEKTVGNDFELALGEAYTFACP